MAYSELVVLVETPIFTRRVQEHLTDDEYARLQMFLAEHPGAGKVIRHSGGIRKLRWPGNGRGKRGGLRVVYYWWVNKDRISLLLIYAKNEQDDLTADQLHQLKSQIEP